MNIKWDAGNYTNNFAFVHQYGEGVMDLLDKPKGSFVVDLGCGNGALTAKLIERGYKALGIDASEDMLNIARENYPEIEFQQADATDFSLAEPCDAIFSNAVFHWIDNEKHENLIQCLANALKTGGQLVCEFGGKDCAEAVHTALTECFAERGKKYRRINYFPSVGEYTPRLEKYGLRVEYAAWFYRMTPQKGSDGAKNWMKMFCMKPFDEVGFDEQTKEEILNEAQEKLRDKLFVNGEWLIDYTRIRIKAKKL